MSTAALLMMLVTEAAITLGAGYFLYRALKAPKRDEPDSFEE